jgi:hypothetical protein
MNRRLIATVTPNYIAKCDRYFSTVPLIRSAPV